MLAVVNTALGADFDLDRFDVRGPMGPAPPSRSAWGCAPGATRRCAVADIGLTVELADGEEIGTEISAKFRREGITSELEAAGFVPMGWWTDACGDFAVTLAQRAADGTGARPVRPAGRPRRPTAAGAIRAGRPEAGHRGLPGGAVRHRGAGRAAVARGPDGADACPTSAPPSGTGPTSPGSSSSSC